MRKKETTLKISWVVLGLAGLMDIRRGVAHTYQVRYSAEHIAGIELIPDSLMLMGAFGISNFLTAFIYFLILWKAREIAPYVLLLIPISYFVGGIGIKLQHVEPDGAFVGRYMMGFYVIVCLVTSLLYFFQERHVKSSFLVAFRGKGIL